MKTRQFDPGLIFSGNTVLLILSSAVFLASLANATQWQVLRAFRFCGIITTLFSLTFFLLSGLELIKHERHKRTIVAAILFLAATVLCLSNGHFVRIP